MKLASSMPTTSLRQSMRSVISVALDTTCEFMRRSPWETISLSE